ncbi:MAG: hypothetical protein HY381_00335 [Candidatus Chisholmbacteria bacterium]|nr:hypothetical protein [Candidatus Chisholmbacteria bacterium]
MSETPSLKEAVTYVEESKAETTSQPRVEEKPTLKPVAGKPVLRKFPWMVVITIIVIAAGVGSGYGLAQKFGGGVGGIKSAAEAAQTGIQVGDVVGSADEKTFKDDAIGVLDQGGIDGEGSHRLYREGGESQNAYLTSSVVDLDQFVGHKVQVWGETFAAQKAGWLMDVGRVKVLELNAEKPF